MSAVIYPGSFDPITMGHVDIIKRLEGHFSQIIVLVAKSSHKNYLFSSEERVDLIKEIFKSSKVISVDSCQGLTTDYAKQNNIKLIVRGIRAVSDFEHEMAMATMNKDLYSDIETLTVFSSPQFNHISSRLVKEVAKHKAKLEGLVPENVMNALRDKI